MMFPQYDWPKRIDTDIIPVGNLPPEQVGALIFSPDGLANIMGGQGIVKNVKEIADRLPNDINALGRGNMVTDLFNAALEANGDNPDTQEPFNNYTEYRNWLIKTGRGVINEKIGGLGVSDAELDPDTKASRQRARALMDMTIDKYAALTARSLRIPKTPDAPTGFFGRLIPHEARKAMEGVTERLFGEETIGAPVSETTPGVKAAAPKRPQAPSSPTLLDVNKVMVQSLPIPDQNRYFRVLQAFMGATDMPGWDAIGPNKKGDLIIKNSKTGKLSLATWDGEIKPVTGLKKKK